MGDLLRAALKYAELGYKVFPCTAKRPIIDGGHNRATTDEDQIRAWWTQYKEASIGLNCEGLVVLDLDCIDGQPNPWPDAADSRADLAKAGAIARTGGGGTHYFYRRPEGAEVGCSASIIAPGVDIRTGGGYVIVPPSVHHTGNLYGWVERHPLDEPMTELPEPPVWLMDRLAKVKKGSHLTPDPGAGKGNKIKPGSRHHAMCEIAGHLRYMGMDADEMADMLQAVNYRRCTQPLPDDEIKSIAVNFEKYEPDFATSVYITSPVRYSVGPAKKQIISQQPEIPARLMRPAGFIADVVDYTMQTAPRPNLSLAFAGALALQGMLCGRKVKCSQGSFTNLFILAIAESGTGKDRPRQVNEAIMSAAGHFEHIQERFASAEGLEDKVLSQPVVIYQTDEIDDILLAISEKKESRYAALSSQIKKLISSAGGHHIKRTAAHRADHQSVKNPSLSIFGTCVPRHLYNALSVDMLDDGFLSRALIIDAGKPARKNQDLEDLELPEKIIDVAKYWAGKNTGLNQGEGNLTGINPQIRTIQYSPQAKKTMRDYTALQDEKLEQADRAGCDASKAAAVRADEKARKMALIAQMSKDPYSKEIDLKSVEWGIELIDAINTYSIWAARANISQNDFHKQQLQLLKALRSSTEKGGMTDSEVARALRLPNAEIKKITESLKTAGNIIKSTAITGKGRPQERWILVEDEAE